STTTPTRQSSCTGTVSSCPTAWMVEPGCAVRIWVRTRQGATRPFVDVLCSLSYRNFCAVTFPNRRATASTAQAVIHSFSGVPQAGGTHTGDADRLIVVAAAA